MDFRNTELMDQAACDPKLVAWSHRNGFACSRCREGGRVGVHRRPRRTSIAAAEGACSTSSPTRFFMASSGGLIIREFAQDISTAQFARELDYDRSDLLDSKHRLQDLACWNRNQMPLDDALQEAKRRAVTSTETSTLIG
jgi:hypothetical protein